MACLRVHGLAAALGAILFALPSVALGATGFLTIVPESCRGPGGCQSVCDIATLANNVLTDAIYIAVFLSAILFAFAGLKMLVSVANPGERSRAKQTFANVAIGLVIILASWLVIEVIMRTLVGGSVLPWNAIC
ncbi:MAG: pilin [Patescibacteria group bacterium]|nr:pilin [Patescibacteria group bacterium]